MANMKCVLHPVSASGSAEISSFVAPVIILAPQCSFSSEIVCVLCFLWHFYGVYSSFKSRCKYQTCLFLTFSYHNFHSLCQFFISLTFSHKSLSRSLYSSLAFNEKKISSSQQKCSRKHVMPGRRRQKELTTIQGLQI